MARKFGPHVHESTTNTGWQFLWRCLFDDFLKPTTGLPDPKGSLSASLPLQAIDLANKEVQNTVNETAATKKHMWSIQEVTYTGTCSV